MPTPPPRPVRAWMDRYYPLTFTHTYHYSMHLFMNVNITHLCMRLCVKPESFRSYKHQTAIFQLIIQINSIKNRTEMQCIENVASSGFVRDAAVHWCQKQKLSVPVETRNIKFTKKRVIYKIALVFHSITFWPNKGSLGEHKRLHVQKHYMILPTLNLLNCRVTGLKKQCFFNGN